MAEQVSRRHEQVALSDIVSRSRDAVGVRSEPSEWMKPKAVAHYYGMTLRGLQEWRARGKGPGWRRLGEREIRYERSSVEAFIRGGIDHGK